MLFQRLFDHLPGVYFFAKNRDGHLMFASQGLLQRYQMHDDSEFIGRTDFDLSGVPFFAFADQDKVMPFGFIDGMHGDLKRFVDLFDESLSY